VQLRILVGIHDTKFANQRIRLLGKELVISTRVTGLKS